MAAQDFLAGMTDRYAVSLFEQLFIPKPWVEDLMLSIDRWLRRFSACTMSPRPSTTLRPTSISASAARPAARQEDRQLRQPQRLPLLLRQRAGRAGHHLDDVSVQGQGRAVGRKGAGQVVATSFSVPAGRWRSGAHGLHDSRRRGARVDARFGEEVSRFDDPSGLVVRAGRDRRATRARRGPAAASTPSGDPRPAQRDDDCARCRSRRWTDDRLSASASWTRPARACAWRRAATRPALIDVVHDHDSGRRRNGLGTVHHVAMAIGTDEEQLAAARGAGGAGLRSPRCGTAATSSRSTSASRRRAVRGRDHEARDSWSTRTSPRSAASEAAAVGRAAPRRDRDNLPASVPLTGPARRTAGADGGHAAGRTPVAVIMVHGRTRGREHPRSRPAAGPAGRRPIWRRPPPDRTWYPLQLHGRYREERAELSSGLRSSGRWSLGRSGGRPARSHRPARLLAGRVPHPGIRRPPRGALRRRRGVQRRGDWAARHDLEGRCLPTPG